MDTTRRQRRYHHHLVELVRRTGDVDHATKHGVPRSTAAGWLAQAALDVVTLPHLDESAAELRARVSRLERRIERLRAMLALVDINFSNSLIEAWWRVPKHNWLLLHPLDSVAKVRNLVEFYVEEHNSSIPHSAFKGHTPDEIYFGRGEGVPDRLAKARASAGATRMEKNRAQQCAVCA